MKKSLERVLINVLWDEEGNEYYRIEKADSSGKSLQDVPDNCGDTGVYLHSEDVDQWIEDNSNTAVVIKDYRDKDA